MKKSQIVYRIYYGARKRWRRLRGFKLKLPNYLKPEDLDIGFPSFTEKSYLGNNTFTFLNQRKLFANGVNWNFLGHGVLWNYNLLYFDYLNQAVLNANEKLRLIHDFLDKFNQIEFARDPYPISLRCINWIKFLVSSDKENVDIELAIYRQYYMLLDNIEYHLMGNHLLENGCSLLFGGIYFDDKKLWQKGQEILRSQLEEQILADGAHLERSPMYHQLLLYRLLDCYNMLKASADKETEFQKFLKSKIKGMLGWLKAVTFSDGSVPCVNDTAPGIAPTTNELNSYSREMELGIPSVVLGESGYRMIKEKAFEWFIDAGNIGPDYIPGHAHSDTLSFVLHICGKPLMVDTGISTYEESDRRIAERSTAAHNTVKINEEEQTEVWKSFRVGRRAHITEMDEGSNYISAEHNGYKHLGIRHRRRFEWSDEELFINDVILGGNQVNATAYFHFHPQVQVRKQGEAITANETTLSFSGHDQIEIKTYRYAEGYNRLKTASVVEVRFGNNLETRISL